MTRIVKKKIYCPNCKKEVVVPIMTSTNSNMIKQDPVLKKKMASGRLFGYSCPICHNALENNNE